MRGKAGPRPSSKKNSRGKIADAGEAQKAAQAEAQAKAVDTTLPMPSTNDVVNLERRCRSIKKQASEISGQIGEMIAQAVEKKSLDRKAFSIARMMNAMSDDKLRVTYHHLLRYFDDLGVTERATAQAEMFAQDGDAEEGDLGENVQRFPGRIGDTAAREVEEAVG